MSRYTVYVVPRAWREMKDLPGKVRHRVKQPVDRLADDPRPARSRQLDAPDLEPICTVFDWTDGAFCMPFLRRSARLMCWPCASGHPMTMGIWQTWAPRLSSPARSRAPYGLPRVTRSSLASVTGG
jgi:hypothetical protein